MKKFISSALIISILLGVVSLTGCQKEPDPLEPVKYKTVPMKYSNEIAQKSSVDTVVRYFYLINNGKFEEANKMIDRTDLSICTPEILESLYSKVENYQLGDYNRIVDVTVDENVAHVTFINQNDDDHSFDVSYEEEEVPIWYGSTTPYVPDVGYASTYEISDLNEDGIIDETDMMWEDNPELNPDYEPPESVESSLSSGQTTSSGARVPYYSTGIVEAQPMAVDIGEIKKSSEPATSGSDNKKSDNKKSESSDKKSSKASASTDNKSEKSDSSTSKNKDSSQVSNDKDSKTSTTSTTDSEVTSNVEPSEDENGLIDGMPADIFKEETLTGYKTYTMDININVVDNNYKVKLPESMTTDTRLMIKVPEDMYIKVGDLELDKTMMNLEDFYVINKLPKVEKFDLTLENLILGSSKKTIDLTERVYYIYSNLVPTREMKDEVLGYIKPAMQSLYSNMLKGTEFTSSSFAKDYVSNKGNVRNIKSYYDMYLNQHVNSTLNESYEIISAKFPPTDEDSATDYEIKADQFRVTSYYFVDVPVVLQIRDNRDDEGDKEITLIEISGMVRLTKQDGKWFIWDISKELMLSDY